MPLKESNIELTFATTRENNERIVRIAKKYKSTKSKVINAFVTNGLTEFEMWERSGLVKVVEKGQALKEAMREVFEVRGVERKIAE